MSEVFALGACIYLHAEIICACVCLCYQLSVDNLACEDVHRKDAVVSVSTHRYRGAVAVCQNEIVINCELGANDVDRACVICNPAIACGVRGKSDFISTCGENLCDVERLGVATYARVLICTDAFRCCCNGGFSKSVVLLLSVSASSANLYVLFCTIVNVI